MGFNNEDGLDEEHQHLLSPRARNRRIAGVKKKTEAVLTSKQRRQKKYSIKQGKAKDKNSK